VHNAETIRDLLVERLRVYRDSGLGEKTIEAREPVALSAAREVLQETRGLRNALASGRGVRRSSAWFKGPGEPNQHEHDREGHGSSGPGGICILFWARD